jgi:hypothetical protein
MRVSVSNYDLYAVNYDLYAVNYDHFLTRHFLSLK